jgi:predicted TPR repeat methyltransferase
LKIASVAKDVLGVDLNADAVAVLHGLGVKSVAVGDAEHLDQLKGGKVYDIVVAGEILEHLPNPGLCLTGARSILAPGGMILVSVPNAFCLKSLLRVGLRRELVHADHVCYYSAATLTRLAEHSGLKCDIVGFYSSRPKNYMKRALEVVFFGWSRIIAPQWAEGLIAVLRPYDDRDRTTE